MKRLKVDLILRENEIQNQSPREIEVRKIFGLNGCENEWTLHKDIEVPLNGLVYISGFSGAGKSTLLKKIKEELGPLVVEAKELEAGKCPIDCFNAPVSESIQWLSQFGLGEARVLITPNEKLSVGQRERLRLALLVWEKPKYFIIDEFLASLDRVTARVIAFQFQKIVQKFKLNCFVATALNDLEDALFPDASLTLDLGGLHTLKEHDWKQKTLPETKELKESEGSLDDYKELSRFHYMEGQAGEESLLESEVMSIRKVTLNNKLIGVRVFTKVFPSRLESKLPVFKLLNSLCTLSSRVIVHPAYRGLGVSALMSFPTHKFPEVRKIFTHSALALHFPFDLKGGYELRKHPSTLRSQWHDSYEQELIHLGLSDIQKLNRPQEAQCFWNSLNADQKTQLSQILIKLLADYDFRYFQYICNELDFEIPEPNLIKMQAFFEYDFEGLKSIDLAPLLSEGLHFPMQGLVKTLAANI